MERTWDLINWLASRFDYKSYLEIGCRGDATFSRIAVDRKVGVDPNSGGTLRVTSDHYFEEICKENFDLIFVDGLHERGQVLRDVKNALEHLNPNGTILMHDCDPPSEERQRVPQGNTRGWCGDVWKAYVELRTRPDLDMACTTFDMGMGVIRVRPNTDPIVLADELTWQTLQANKPAWLRQMETSDLLKWIP